MIKIQKKLHIILIILGTIFICLPGLHQNVWFDEAYSISITRYSFMEIWEIGAGDVHPVLYYWMLKLLFNIFGENILLYKIFSMIPCIILAILGYTHIKKDFGERIGFIFTLLFFFIPETSIYATQIRMYSWSILIVSIETIYFYRIIKYNLNKNWIIFLISSIIGIYLHYYSLIIMGILDVIIFLYFVKNKKGQGVKRILIIGLAQFGIYIPWMQNLFLQLNDVKKGFWIGFKIPDTIIEIIGAQYIGVLNYNIALLISIILYLYIVRKIKNEKDIVPVKISFLIYISVIIIVLIITLVLDTMVIHYRYLYVISGLYIFALSYIIGKEKNKFIYSIIISFIIFIGILNNLKLIKINYNKSNDYLREYIQSNIRVDDYIIYNQQEGISIGNIYTVNNKKQIFYNNNNWRIQKSYKAFDSQMKIINDENEICNINGRIWIIDNQEKEIFNKLFNNYKYEIVEDKLIKTTYHNYKINIILVKTKKVERIK